MTDHQTFSYTFASWMVRRRWELLVVAVVLATLAVFPASKVSTERSFASMLSEDDPLFESFQKLARVFKGNEVVLAVYDDPQLFDASGVGLRRLTEIRLRIMNIDGVEGVLSIDNIVGDRILDESAQVSSRIRKLFEGITHGEDHSTVAVVCMLDPNSSSSRRGGTIAELRKTLQNLPDGLRPGTLAGEPVMAEDAFTYVQSDGRRLFLITTILLGAVILACFRSARWVLVPIAVVQLSLLLTNATMGLLEIKTSLVSSMLTAVVTVIGIATVVHIIVKFRASRQDGADQFEAMRETIADLASPVAWACVTDAVGFGALLFSRVSPIRDFGLMMAVGSLMVLLSVLLLLPGLGLFGNHRSDPRRPWGEASLDKNLLGLADMVYRHPAIVGATALIASLIAIYGIGWLNVETDFTRNFRESTPIVQSYQLVESRLGGAGVLDIVIPAPEPLTWEYLRQVLVLEQDLRKNVMVTRADGSERKGVAKAISLADVIVCVSPKNLERVRWRRVRNSLVASSLTTIRKKIPFIFDSLYGKDRSYDTTLQSESNQQSHYLRVTIRAEERQSSEQKKRIISQVQSIATEHFPNSEVTGFFAIITGLIDSILRDQWKTFGAALIGIFITMSIAFRNIRLALIATIPNSFPILVVNGLMGWTGIKMNMGGAMIAAVSMGLSIDSSIHYLMAYNRARSSGLPVGEALSLVQKSVGRAMVFSTVALIIGFAALAISEFVPTIYFGILVSISMLGALFGNLVWLPLLLRMFQPVRSECETPCKLTVAGQRG